MSDANFECGECPMAEPDDCMKAGHCEHRDGPPEDGALIVTVARALAKADQVDFDERCGMADGGDDCDSGTCVAAWDEDHDAPAARRFYLSRARAALGAMNDAREDFLVQLRRVNGERWQAWAASDEPDPLYQSNEFGGEAGEVQNVVKKLVRESRGWRGSRATVAQLADEIADCIICLDSLARSYDIDLTAAVAAKFNATSVANDFPHRLVSPFDLAEQEPCRECDDSGFIETSRGGHWTGEGLSVSQEFCGCPCGDDARRQYVKDEAGR